jgi:hypothetical protein
VMSKGAEAASQGLEARGGRKQREDAVARLAQAVQEEEVGLTSGACMSARWKRQGTKAKDTNPKGKCVHENTSMAHGLSGLAEEAMACRMCGPAQGRLGRLGQIQGEDSVRN